MKKYILILVILISKTVFSEADKFSGPSTGATKDKKKGGSTLEQDLNNMRLMKNRIDLLKKSYLIKLEKAPQNTRKDIIHNFHKKRLKHIKTLNNLKSKVSLRMSKSKSNYNCGNGMLFERGQLMICEDGSLWRKSGDRVSPSETHIKSHSRDRFKSLFENESGIPYYGSPNENGTPYDHLDYNSPKTLRQ